MNMKRRFLLIAAAMLPAAAARAHAHLRGAVPAPGSMIDAAPATVALSFSEAVEPSLCSVAVTDGAGARFDDGPAVAGPTAKDLVVKLKTLPPGSYSVSWHATSVDTHRTEGTFSFMLHG